MKSGAGRSSLLPACAILMTGCVSIPFDAPPGRLSGEGSMTIEPAVVAASSENTFRITLTVGPSGLVQGGGFRLELPVDPVHPYLGFTPPHTDKEYLRGYVQCLVRRSGAGAVVASAEAWSEGSEAGCSLATGSLNPGDLLIMEYWGLSPRTAMALPLHVESRYSGGSGGRMPAWPPVLTVMPRPARVLTAVLPGTVSAGQPTTLAIVARDEFGNRAIDYRGTVAIRLGTARFNHTFTSDERGVALLSGPVVDQPGFVRAEIIETDIAESLRLTAVSNPALVTGAPDVPLVLWGDLHAHTGTGAGGRPFMRGARLAGDHRGNYTRADDAYAYARDVMRLDFAAVTEHATTMMSDEAWQMSMRAAAAALEPGRFTTFAAFQWDDRLVLLPSETGVPVRSDERLTDEPGELAAALAAGGESEPMILKVASTAPPAGTGAVEIYSWRNRGAAYEDNPSRFEPDASWLPVEPHRSFTLIAGSDNHWGMPGMDDAMGLEPGNGGLTAVEAPRNDRASILEALRQGHAWATTGARIQMKVSRQEGRLAVKAAGTAPFTRIELVVIEKTGKRVFPVMTSPGLDFEGAIEWPHLSGPAFCYVRAVQQDGEMAWSSLEEGREP